MQSLCAVQSFFAGCKASPAPDAGFIENYEFVRHDPRKPFDAIWFNEGIDLRKYHKILVRPVDISHLLEMSWWQKLEISQAFDAINAKAESEVLAKYMEEQIKAAFASHNSQRYQIVDQQDADTIIVEIALVEVVPTKVWLNAVSYVFIGALDTGSAAIEGRFRDGGTGEIIVLLKDREHGQYSLVSLADLQWYAHAKHIIDHWAEQFVEMCDLPPEAEISSSWPVTLRPW